ncbi:MAG: efflux RND transporter periplasmic adaptor subunit [Pirellulaceae bacterium]
MNGGESKSLFWTIRKPALIFLVVVAACVLGVGVWSMMRDLGDSETKFVYYTVSRSDLPIVVTERGNLEAQLKTEIRCQCESVTRDARGNYGTQIIFIVPNGSAVEERELLVELDSAPIRERLDEQILRHQKAVSAHVQSKARFENQKLQNETALAEAILNVELATLQLDSYTDKLDGQYKLDVEELDRTILEWREGLEIAKADRAGAEELFNLGYNSKSVLDQKRFALMKAQNDLAASISRQRQMTRFTKDMTEKQLRGSLETTKRSLKQVKNDNESEIAQAEASLLEAEAVEKKEKERLDNYGEQLEFCKIYAPHDGMVVYARQGRGNSTEIEEGATVRQRQEILSLPNLSRMQVKTQVHEAVLDQVRSGLPVTIRIDAFPNEVYYGIVSDVAVVPSDSGWWGSGVKTYETVVTIDGEVKNLKPGMTAVTEIHVDRIEDVLTVPVQAVVQRGRDSWCYVDAHRGLERRMLTLGRSNDKFVHVEEGMAQGDRVVLNPMSVLEETEEKTESEISPEMGESEIPEAIAQDLQRKANATMAKAAAAKKKKMSERGSPKGALGMRRPGGKKMPGRKPGESGKRSFSTSAKTSGNET